MVHALREAWRVLIPGGIMIDQRPVCLDAPIDILNNDQSECAGIADMSPDLDSEIAAESAIENLVTERIFEELKVERFEIAYYWKTVKGMMADIRARWMDDLFIEEKVIQRAYKLFGKHHTDKKVRLLLQMKLTKYEK